MNRNRILHSLSIIALWMPVAASAQQVFWLEPGDTDKINRMDLNGGGVVTLVEADIITAFTVDAQAGNLYWGASAVGLDPRIMRSDLNGLGAVMLVGSAATTSDIAIDHTNGRIYWTDFAQGKIQRADLDGANAQLLTTVGLHVNGIALDPGAGRMFYTVTSTDFLWSADLDATNATPLVSSSSGLALGVAVDPENGRVYFSEVGVQSADLDGSAIAPVVADSAAGIALDLTKGMIYWANLTEGKIKRAPIGGGAIEDVVTGLDRPKRIAVLAAPPCPADINGDTLVDTADLGGLLGAFGNTGTPGTVFGDINEDGIVDTADLGILLGSIGPCPM